MADVTAPHYVLEQKSSRATAILSFAVFLPAACSIFIPVGLVAAHTDTATQLVFDQPLAALQIVTGLLVWIALFVVPVLLRLQRLGLSRRLVIENARVEETVKTLFRSHRSVRPLVNFGGIVHRVRTSVGGMRHELALVERNSCREIVFQEAPVLDRAAIDRAIRVLGLAEIKAADLVLLGNARDMLRIVSQSSERQVPALHAAAA